MLKKIKILGLFKLYVVRYLKDNEGVVGGRVK